MSDAMRPSAAPDKPDTTGTPDSISRSRALALLVFGAVAISFSPVFVKVAVRDGLGPTSVAFWRMALGAGILVLIVPTRRATLAMPAPLLWLALVAGAVFTADLYLWHRSIALVGAGMATMLASTQVFNTAVLTWLFFRERPRRTFYPAAAMGLIGVALLAGLGGGVALVGDRLTGVLYGLCTGLAYAGYLVTTRTMARRSVRPRMLTVVAWISIMGALCSLVVCGLEEDVFLPRHTSTWLALAGLGALVQAAGWWAITVGLPRVKASTAGLILLLQPTLATVWGWLLFGEALAPLQLVGAGLTVSAIYLGTVVGKK